MKLDKNFWDGRRVLLTGHTGFKGIWMSLLLESLGANVSGISLPPETQPNLYEILSSRLKLKSFFCDICDPQKLTKAVTSINPQIVIHMAAQSLVRESYRAPISTINTNVMGTMHLLESLRTMPDLEAVLIITSDKVYAKTNASVVLSENHPLGGHDLYSASKAATEILTSAYAQSFYAERNIPIFTARAGNVIGGGDWAKDRIIPDLWRAYESNQTVELRYPEATRPWQHVLDPIYGYLLYVEQMARDPNLMPKALNFGPSAESTCTVLELAEQFVNTLKTECLWTIAKTTQMPENKYLSIDASLAKQQLSWRPMLEIENVILWTVQWYKAFQEDKNMYQFSKDQINDYLELIESYSIELNNSYV